MPRQRKPPANDYMKYWRVVRRYIKVRYGISFPDLEMLLFLYSEKYFSKTDFNTFDEVFHWDDRRFDRLLRDGHIVVFRKRGIKQKQLYEISYATKRVIGLMYNILNGDEIPTSKDANPMFLKNVSYTDKVYRNGIMKMNNFIRQQQRLSR